jgi:HD-like signal output (HDOD) protein
MAKVTEISSLPEVTTKIVQVVEDPRATAYDMHELVRTDPALAAKILKVVNSAFYGLPAQISSLDRAILLLGLSAVKNIALAASLSRLFKADAISEQFAARDLWRHCIAVGVCARQLAQAAGSAETDEAFVAGLVHDLGLITAQQILPAQMREVSERCLNAPEPFCEIERQIIGADHQTFGGVLAMKWKFPPKLTFPIAYHHEPLAVRDEYRRATALVYVADVLCTEARFGFWLTAQAQELTDEILAVVELTRTQLDGISAQLAELVDEAERIFTD